MEVSLVDEFGLAEFTRLAWSQVEPGPLLWNWHIDAICQHLEAVTRGDIKDLLVLVPPGCMKTLLTAVFWPAWEWTLKPKTKWIFASYGQSLSEKSAKQMRDLVTSPWYVERWGDVCRIDTKNSQLVKLFDNTAKGFRFSTSVGGEVTGRHGDRLVFDDLVKAQDATGRASFDHTQIDKANDFWTKTMATRAANPSTVSRVGIMQRLHQNDTAAVCKSEGYEVLELPMEAYGNDRATCIGFRDPRALDELLWPERMGAEFVHKMKTSLGRDYFAQYQQNPTPPSGIEVKADWIKHWGEPGSKWMWPSENGMFWFQSWDLARKDASTSDFVVGQTWACQGNDFLLIDQVRGRWEYTLCLQKMVEMQIKWPKVTQVVIEDAANGTAALSSLKGKLRGMVGVSPNKSKVLRLREVAPLFEGGSVYLPPRAQNPWVESLVSELLAFPFGKHDDQVDALTQALNKQQGANSSYMAALRKISYG